jgi:phage terminase large subunit-like protein
VVAIDPPGGSSRTNAEAGIVVAGVVDKRFYVLCDASGRASPEQWSRIAVDAFHDFRADRIVAERNFGGDMVESTIRSVDPLIPLRLVTASRGKAIRAEPIASLYEQSRVHHVGEFPQLEDQMCSWDPMAGGPSPDRLDALVWALTDLSAETVPFRTVLL